MNKTTEIAVQYHLPTNWEQEKAYSFDHLSVVVTLLHDSAYSATIKAVNRFATVRNYVIGYYIVEYEQHGSDRAKYGDRLLKRLAERVNKRGINETLLQICRKFYTAYPQIYAYLTGEISAMTSHKFVDISATASDVLLEKIRRRRRNSSLLQIDSFLNCYKPKLLCHLCKIRMNGIFICTTLAQSKIIHYLCTRNKQLTNYAKDIKCNNAVQYRVRETI